MGLFRFLKKKAEEEKDNSSNASYNLVPDMYIHIAEKCKYGDAMENINEYERIFYIAQELEGEVNNGGFAQYFYNPSGNFASETVNAFTQIGALKTAEICKKAISAFKMELPADRAEREELLDNMDWDGIGGINEILDECDHSFYAYEDDLHSLCLTYITAHKAYFDKL
ncbi:MAG: DMP19 family protein [Eubacterium sp.]|nr:DMP19 family protein [Eubacterium sp.]